MRQKLADSGQATVRAAALRGFGALAGECGLSGPMLLREAGLPVDAEQHPDSRLPAAALNWLLELAAARSGLDDFGLRLAGRRGFSNLGPLTALARDEPDIGSALGVMISFLPLHNDALEIRRQEADDLVILAIAIRDRQSTVQAVDVAVAMLHRILETLFGDGWSALMVCFERARPARIEVAERLFGRRPLYGQDFSGLVLSRADLERPNARAEADLRPYLAGLRQQLAAAPDLAAEVRQIIGLLLPTGRCQAALVAAQLGLSRRTLDRRLAAEGTSFHALLDGARREIAWRQLHDSRRALTDIAALLGFRGLPAFSAWFRAGFGLSPRAARRAGRGEVAPGLRVGNLGASAGEAEA